MHVYQEWRKATSNIFSPFNYRFTSRKKDKKKVELLTWQFFLRILRIQLCFLHCSYSKINWLC